MEQTDLVSTVTLANVIDAAQAPANRQACPVGGIRPCLGV
jgi:hypothetical protein